MHVHVHEIMEDTNIACDVFLLAQNLVIYIQLESQSGDVFLERFFVKRQATISSV